MAAEVSALEIRRVGEECRKISIGGVRNAELGEKAAYCFVGSCHTRQCDASLSGVCGNRRGPVPSFQCAVGKQHPNDHLFADAWCYGSEIFEDGLFRGDEQYTITDQNKIQSLLNGLAKNKLMKQPDGKKPPEKWKYRVILWAADGTGAFSFTDTGDFRKDAKCTIPGSAGYYLPQYPDMIRRLLDSYCKEVLGVG